MRALHSLGLGALTLVLGVGSARADRKNVNYATVARRLVEAAVPIHEGDKVLISVGAGDAELADELFVQVRRKGAYPFVALAPSSRIWTRLYSEVPERYDARTDLVNLSLASMFDVQISAEVDGPGAGVMESIPSERLSRRNNAAKVVFDATMARRPVQLSLGNGLHPGPNNAADRGVSEAELADVFWSGLDVNYARLAATAKAVQSTLAKGKLLEITHPNGTNLKVRVEGRKVLTSDGVVTEEERAEGGAAALVWLPAGEVYLTPVPGTAEGTIVDDHVAASARSREIEGLTCTVKGGRLVSMKAKSPMETLQKDYDAEPAGRDQLSVLDIEINPNVRPGPKSKLESWVAAGTISYSFGGNEWAGGDVAIPVAMIGHLPGCTVKLDGKVIIENGVLKP